MNKITKELISTIAENQPKVKEQGVAQGIEQGKQEIITNSKYIEKTASGKAIRLDDVSEVAHNVVVKADTPTEVEVYGSNFIDYTKAEARDGNSSVVINIDGSITYTGNFYFRIPITLQRNTTYILSYEGIISTAKWTVAYNRAGNDIATPANIGAPITTKADADAMYVFIYPYKANAENGTTTISDIQLSFGGVVKPYEPFQEQTITATPDGTEIPSICPNMTFIADTDVAVDYFGSYGMQTEYDRFWDDLQWNGERTNYASAFGGYNFSFNNFYPKYDIICVGDASRLFYTWRSARTSNMTPGSLKQRLEECGVILDTSQAPNVSAMFGYGCFTELPVIDISNVTQSANSSGIFYNDYGYLKTIEKLIVSENTVLGGTAFSQNTALENIVFEGVLASDINLQWSKKLDLESLISLFYCLKVYSSDNADYCTKTITLSAESWALTESQDFQDALGYTDGQAMCRDLGWNYA